MKKVKRLLSIAIIIVLSVCVFSACDFIKQKDKKDEKENSKFSGEEVKIEEVVVSFVDALYCGDEAALNYVDKKSKFFAAAKNSVEITANYSNIYYAEAYEAKLYGEDADNFVAVFENARFELLDEITIEVDSIEIKDKKATVKYKTVHPDPTELETVFGKLDKGKGTSAEKKIKAAQTAVDAKMKELLASEYTETAGIVELNKIDGEWKVVNAES